MDQDTVWFPRVEFALTSPMEGGADFTGIGGGFRVESVADLPWNGWQLCYGISGNIRTEYAVITPVFQKKNYVILEEPLMSTSNFNTVGLLYADIIGYLAARIDTISTDSELFEGITPEQFETNGKIKKLKSSVDLISKIKNIGQYEIKV